MSETGPGGMHGQGIPQQSPPPTTSGAVPSGWPSMPTDRTRPTASTGPAGAGPADLSRTGPVPMLPEPDDQSGPVPPTEAPRRQRLLIGAVVGAVAVVGIVVAIVASQGGDDAAMPTPDATTIMLPSPTPAIEPIARESVTAFAAAMPVTVLQYALASSVPEPTWVAAGAIEAYTDTFSDGASGQVVVQSGQWENAEEAAGQALALVAALPVTPPSTDPTATDGAAEADGDATDASVPSLPQSGDVLVGGSPVGTYQIVDTGAGTGVAVWTNGSTVLSATAPVAQIRDVYAAFPL